MSKPEFKTFVPEVIDRLQVVSDTYLERYDEHAAFVYMIAEMYETTREENFVYTDGPKDGNIDFIVKQTQGYTIGQCKCPNADNISETPTKYDESAVEELKAAVDMLTDRTGNYDVKAQIKRLRGDYQRDVTTDPDGTTLTAILAILGSLTEPALRKFEAYQKSLRRQRVFLKLIQWSDIYHTMHALESPSDVDFEMSLHYDKDTDLLAHRDYCYVLCHAIDLYEAFRRYEWNLFEWNVRYQIPNSPVNKRIVAALSRDKSRKLFHHYNNGLLVTCRSYRKDQTRKRVTLVGPQIVNGCQTVRAICEAYENLSPEDQNKLRDQTRVQIKVIQTTDAEFIGQLVISTNDQNPMNPRNLKSNTAEQREIQKLFRNLPMKWFMERKDGEFKSLLSTSTQVRWFRKSDYAVAPRRYRVIDNQDLAKAWYSFTGYSHNALRGGIDYFADEEDGAYTTIFQSIPGAAFWSAFVQPTFQPSSDLFVPGIPSVYQYLLAMSIGSYVDSRRVSFKNNRQEAIKRGIQNGNLRGDAVTGRCTNTPREIDEYLNIDLDYFLNIMINNMREVLIELYSLILCMKYTTCDPQTSQRLTMELPKHKEFIESAFDSTKLSVRQERRSLIGPIYEFLKDCVKQFYFEYEAEIHAAPRLKSYLAQRSTINRFRSLIVKRDQSIKEYDVEWKLSNKSFVESLPEL